ncbi:MAG: hypothetical protein ACYDCJ_13540 [Gammaproteobacteria bacterium]
MSIPNSGSPTALAARAGTPFTYDVTGVDTNVSHVAALSQTAPGMYGIVKVWSKETFFTTAYRGVTHLIEPLVTAIQSQKRHLEYNSFYISYLLKQITEKQLEHYAKSIAFKPKQMDASIVAKYIYVLRSATNIDFTEAELSDIFECDKAIIDAAIKLMTTQKSIK